MTYTIPDDKATVDLVLRWLVRVEHKLRAQGVDPMRVLVGADLYILLDHWMQRHGNVVVDGVRGVFVETIRGLDLICDPFLSPMDLRVIGSNENNACRRTIVAEANVTP